MKNQNLAFNIGLVLAAVFVVGAAYFSIMRPAEEKAPADMSEFALQTENGKLSQLVGHWTVVVTGYTTCPDVCPAALAYAAREYNTWDNELRDNVRVAFLTVDPSRDQISNLTAYVQYFQKDFIPLRLEEPKLKEFTKAIGAFYSYDEEDSASGYLVSHSSAFFVFNPKGKRVSLFKEPHKKDNLTKFIRKLSQEAI